MSSASGQHPVHSSLLGCQTVGSLLLSSHARRVSSARRGKTAGRATVPHSSALACTLCGLGAVLLWAQLGAKISPARAQQADEDEAGTCGVFNSIGFNDLTPVDVVVRNPDTNLVCIKARFSLAIKVESTIAASDDDDQDEPADGSRRAADSPLEKIIKGDSFLAWDQSAAAAGGAPSVASRPARARERKIVLGYLPLEHVIQIEESCPERIRPPAGSEEARAKPPDKAANGTGSAAADQPADQADQADELEMIVTFECGKLAFTFQRNSTRTYLSSIKGLVKLDQKVVREFIARKPMLITSDLEHHFKYDDLIVIESEPRSQAYILSANLYFTEIETFRSTTSRDFIRPADERSRPFLEDGGGDDDDDDAGL